MAAPPQDRVLVAFDSPMFGHLRGPAHPMQQQRGTFEAVSDVKQGGDQLHDPGQGPPLILGVSRGRWPSLQPLPQPLHLLGIQLRRSPDRSLGLQGIRPTRDPRASPGIRRLRRHLQPCGDLNRGDPRLKQRGSLLPHLFPSQSVGLIQPATIAVSHPPSVQPATRDICHDTPDLNPSRSVANVARHVPEPGNSSTTCARLRCADRRHSGYARLNGVGPTSVTHQHRWKARIEWHSGVRRVTTTLRALRTMG